MSVPTLAQRRGDFSALPVTIFDPRTTRPNPAGTGSIRDPFPGNVIPQERLSPISRYFQSFLPEPTNGDLQNNYLGGNLPIGFDNDNGPIEGPVPPQNELVWWDADLLREIHSRGAISKWKGAELGRTEGSVQHVADITGDWREEIVTFVNGQLRIYGTSIPATDRRVTMMQDRLYRNDVTHRSMGYPHVPMTSYYLGVATRRQ